MKLLFENKQIKTRTEVYALERDELFCRHFDSFGDIYEFLLDDSSRMRELLRTCLVYRVKARRRDFLGGVAFETFRIDINNVSLAKIIFNEVYGTEAKAVYLISDVTPKDYRIANLTQNQKEITYTTGVLANRELFLDRTLRNVPAEAYGKRMNSTYSNLLSSAVSRNNRKKSKINEAIVAKIRDAYKKGATQPEIGYMYGLSRTAIADILNYRTWNEHEFSAEDIVVEDFAALPQIPYQVYADEATRLNVDPAIMVFTCEGFVYKLQQKVDFQVYLGKYLPTGKYVADAHLTVIKRNDRRNRNRNYVISYVRGNRVSNYYMSKQDIYSLVKSYVAYI